MTKRAILLLFVISYWFVGCNRVEPEQVKLSTHVLQLKVGEVHILTAVATQEVIWHSSDTLVAEVMKGVVTGKQVGTALITARVGNAEAVCQVYVTGREGQTLALPITYLQLERDTTYQMCPSSLYDLPLVWQSSDTSVAIVEPSGLVRTKQAGHTTITVSNGFENASCYVAVKHRWSEYQLVWSDEFDGTTLNAANWNIEVNGNGGGNQELQYYTSRPTNLRVENGILIIEAHKENYQGKRYTSARINTMNKQTFLYGKIEARIAFPSGGGTWPAFWMMGQDYSRVGWPACGEIDIVEHVGNEPNMNTHALHYPYKSGGNCWSVQKQHENIENQYHTYAIEWLQEEEYGRDIIRFLYDGQLQAVQSETLENMDNEFFWPFNKPHFILLNMAIGGSMGGQVNEQIFNQPIQMKVDWVRVYQRTEI
ncbi:MAG: family 16 glycosylhydrolase [Paludibacteraceae bacterium]|nr:family 16 glycosylhydrolase [Paludibacteraceae bacterium]